MALDQHALNGLLNSVQQQLRGVQDLILTNQAPLAPALTAMSQPQSPNSVPPLANIQAMVDQAVEARIKAMAAVTVPDAQVEAKPNPPPMAPTLNTIDPPIALAAPKEEENTVGTLSLGFLLKVMGAALTVQQQEWVTANLSHLPAFLLSEEGKASFQYTIGNMQRFVAKKAPSTEAEGSQLARSNS